MSLLWTAGGTLVCYPDQLAYFNEAAGGPEEGWRHLLGSSVDWGQCRTAVPSLIAAKGYAVRPAAVVEILRGETRWFFSAEFNAYCQGVPDRNSHAAECVCSVNLLADPKRYREFPFDCRSDLSSSGDWSLMHPTTALVVQSDVP